MPGQTNGSFSGPVPLWIDGKEATTSTTFDVESPNDSKKLWSSSSASVKEAAQACEAAQKASKSWRKTKGGDIQKILLKAADIMEARSEELASYMKEETGALEGFCQFNLVTTVDYIRSVAGLASSVNGVIPQTKTPGQAAFLFKEPYGVILGIAPWNAPYILGTRAFLFAIAAGNTAVFKGSELSPRTFWAIGSVFKEAGLPDGVLNIIYHRPQDAVDVTNALIENPSIKKVNFTGSTAVGSIIASKAGKELKPVLMELGGKASAYVAQDANIDNAAMQVALGSFLHAGQVCMATERVLVHRSILDKFGEALKAATEKVYAPTADAPVLIAKPGVQKNIKLREDAVSKGAKVLYGDVSAKEDSAYRVRPLIVSDVTKDMDIFYTESFGPTLSLIAVDSDEEAIDIANDTEYGLSGAIFTESLGRGLKIAKEIDSGAIHINSMSIHDEANLPHGGVKKSGWGRFNAQWGLEEFVKIKTITYMES
ncbi:Vanillin dehydrogenase [Cercospora beticola]|uniref:Vanillin dehydrogenase n=1 Tax=Cercospora beticola TaxID=122368 RepID=A0A2G5IEI7_CERBT|nr:Vanillin dehydrogenase [Cercospora beticola]PIB02883.1 Vanillin dehydrogenase [Cercospora beticola]WPB04408.1 hypothetical protein RHO25_009054 [Cercospora beticola]